MTLTFRILLIIGAILVFVYMLRKIRSDVIKIENCTFWFLFAAGLVLLALFPQIAFFFSGLLGIQSPANLVFCAIIAVLVIREFMATVEIAHLRKRITTLVQDAALAEDQQASNQD